ncbi:MAG: hypothetical protein COT15_03845 [Candidatus Diapherotrites archaeon CG08_land_8_20_14_0_20_34_12]|nr:MAG: hypothetical protein COT15_03845 [Candidatus Diapherotrites archaeon CG08_land_8_20_14_0_20_34_12]
MKAKNYLKAFIPLIFLGIFLMGCIAEGKEIKCNNETCLYENFLGCKPATLNVEPYDKIGVSTITISGVKYEKCNYSIVSTPHASDVPQLKNREVPMDSLTKENFEKIIEEAKNL